VASDSEQRSAVPEKAKAQRESAEQGEATPDSRPAIPSRDRRVDVRLMQADEDAADSQGRAGDVRSRATGAGGEGTEAAEGKTVGLPEGPEGPERNEARRERE